MAEVLVKLELANLVADQANAWTRLHPVCAFEDGHVWGSEERPPKFLVIRITDMTLSEVLPYLEPSVDTTLERPVQVAIRRWKIDIDDAAISQQIKNRIAARLIDGQILEVTKAQIVNFIKRVAP